MKRLILSSILFFILPLSTFAAPSSGGSGGLQDACEISGGTFTGSESGNWACCWPDWGCYGCVDNNCKIKCNTARCRDANGQAAVNTNGKTVPGTKVSSVKGLAPKGMRNPVVPSKYFKAKTAAPAGNMKAKQ